MNDEMIEFVGWRFVIFGWWKVMLCVCVVDSKWYLCVFFGEILEDFGFVISECVSVDELNVVLISDLLDLILFGVVIDGIEFGCFFEILVCEVFVGKVFVVGVCDFIIVRVVW